MAKFTDKQILQLLVSRINELRELASDESSGSSDLDLFRYGQRSVLDSLSSTLSFLSDYEFE